MLTVEMLSSKLGLSPWQVRRLIYTLRPVLDGLMVSAKGRPLEISPQAIGILERAMQLRASGVPLNNLAKVLQKELHGTALDSSGKGNEGQGLAQDQAKLVQEVLEAKDALIEELKKERDYWRDLALRLQNQVEELHHLALPAPKKREQAWPWRFLRWFWS